MRRTAIPFIIEPISHKASGCRKRNPAMASRSASELPVGVPLVGDARDALRKLLPLLEYNWSIKGTILAGSHRKEVPDPARPGLGIELKRRDAAPCRVQAERLLRLTFLCRCPGARWVGIDRLYLESSQSRGGLPLDDMPDSMVQQRRAQGC